ncbi:MAG TPA: rhodanese-like domain-containing protein [Rhizomicrobium sp.]|jgi:rhodanese-related sulfurtransferase
MVPLPPLDYAGDVTAQEAWTLIQSNPKAQLVDVRTMAEWNFVGLPDLTSLGRRIHCVEWQGFPGGALNPGFVDGTVRALEGAGAGKSDPVLFLCRSGARSRAAAIALSAAGYTSALNVAGGFEGDSDEEGHRGNTNGWKASGLPWRQG